MFSTKIRLELIVIGSVDEELIPLLDWNKTIDIYIDLSTTNLKLNKLNIPKTDLLLFIKNVSGEMINISQAYLKGDHIIASRVKKPAKQELPEYLRGKYIKRKYIIADLELIDTKTLLAKKDQLIEIYDSYKDKLDDKQKDIRELNEAFTEKIKIAIEPYTKIIQVNNDIIEDLHKRLLLQPVFFRKQMNNLIIDAVFESVSDAGINAIKMNEFIEKFQTKTKAIMNNFTTQESLKSEDVIRQNISSIKEVSIPPIKEIPIPPIKEVSSPKKQPIPIVKELPSKTTYEIKEETQKAGG